MRPLQFAALLLLPASLPLTARAQFAPDEGTLVVSRNGATIGRESFRLVPNGPDAHVFVATAQAVYGTRRLAPALTVDTAGSPVLYRIEIRDGSALEERLQATGRPGRLSTVVQTARGESAKEYVLAPGTMVLDDEVFHQYALVAARRAAHNVMVLVPRSAQVIAATVESRGTESIDVDGRKVQATHVVLTLPGDTRDVWVDAHGHLLRVAIPSAGLVAVRDELPR